MDLKSSGRCHLGRGGVLRMEVRLGVGGARLLRVTLHEGGAQRGFGKEDRGGSRSQARWGCLLTEHPQAGCSHGKCLARVKNSPTEKSWKLPLNKIN